MCSFVLIGIDCGCNSVLSTD